jgi:hypothetical protein
MRRKWSVEAARRLVAPDKKQAFVTENQEGLSWRKPGFFDLKKSQSVKRWIVQEKLVHPEESKFDVESELLKR